MSGILGGSRPSTATGAEVGEEIQTQDSMMNVWDEMDLDNDFLALHTEGKEYEKANLSDAGFFNEFDDDLDDEDLLTFKPPTSAITSLTMPFKGGDLKKGKKLAETRAGQCHTFAEGGANGVGPNLFGIVGRTSGTVPGFGYSKANQDAAVTWTQEVLDEYITNPKKFMPGNKMAFAGLKKEKDRADLITFLETLN